MHTDYKYLGFLKEYVDYYGFKRACTPEDVDKIEQRLGVRFPLCYRELYLILGVFGAFAFRSVMDFVYDEYEEMWAFSKEITSADGHSFLEDKNVFVFAAWGVTSVCWFFKLDEGDDPPVYMYESPADSYVKVLDNLSEFIKLEDWYLAYLTDRAAKRNG
ncbi:SMI1/KNR4 family protein [Chitinophaga rhizophila]|uniref:SMI1/KNR4 family protein n=1 Tax=Chitinophaga rhizophila TaxID=2866212 RepID=A0ABS7GLQ7_9BACT|nr:SMI1/KNR4 family protein [Chitinophaga rhizophila]MBW8687749.1 SMI1/KNR4 family protein [Chitinophaga rhizophila]